MADPTELLSPQEVTERVEQLAALIAPRVSDGTIGVCLLTGGIWFAADLMRALHRCGRDLRFDALWIASYGDAKTTSGAVRVHGSLQRSVRDQQVLLMDDVMDSGLSLLEATRLVKEAGAAEVLTCVFARKPWDSPRAARCDFVAWEAPARFLVGYGMDVAGGGRGRPGIAALD